MAHLPAWQQGDLPHPPAPSLRNAVRVIGPVTTPFSSARPAASPRANA